MSIRYLFFNPNCTDQIRVSFDEKEVVSFVDGCIYWFNDKGHFFSSIIINIDIPEFSFYTNFPIISDNSEKENKLKKSYL